VLFELGLSLWQPRYEWIVNTAVVNPVVCLSDVITVLLLAVYIQKHRNLQVLDRVRDYLFVHFSYTHYQFLVDLISSNTSPRVLEVRRWETIAQNPLPSLFL